MFREKEIIRHLGYMKSIGDLEYIFSLIQHKKTRAQVINLSPKERIKYYINNHCEGKVTINVKERQQQTWANAIIAPKIGQRMRTIDI